MEKAIPPTKKVKNVLKKIGKSIQLLVRHLASIHFKGVIMEKFFVSPTSGKCSFCHLVYSRKNDLFQPLGSKHNVFTGLIPDEELKQMLTKRSE